MSVAARAGLEGLQTHDVLETFIDPSDVSGNSIVIRRRSDTPTDAFGPERTMFETSLWVARTMGEEGLERLGARVVDDLVEILEPDTGVHKVTNWVYKICNAEPPILVPDSLSYCEGAMGRIETLQAEGVIA